MTGANDHWRLLLAHEFRLTWRHWRLDKWSSGTSGHIALAVLLAIGLHLVAWIFVALMPHNAPATAESAAWVGFILLMLAAVMLASALSSSVEALFERNDLDLLFSAPIFPRPVLMARTLTVAGATLFLHGVYLLPIANMAMLTGRTWLWSLYLVAPLMALLLAAIAMLVSLSLVKLLGARRTRTLVQVIAVIAGALGFLLTQFGPRASRSLDFSASSAGAIPVDALNLIAQPVLGDLRALLALALAATALCALAWTRLDRVFLRGSQEIMIKRARKRPRKAHVRAQRMTRNLVVDVCSKEWRSIARDPLLMTRIGLTFAYMAPALVIVWRGDTSDPWAATAATATCVFVASLLSQQLAQLTVNMEDAPQLLLASPRSVSELLTAKTVAAAVPAGALAIGLLCLVGWTLDPVALIAAPLAAAAAWTSASMIASRVRLIPRAQFGKRGGQPEIVTGLLVLFVGLLLAGAGALLVTRFWWAAFPILLIPIWVAMSTARTLARIRSDSLIQT